MKRIASWQRSTGDRENNQQGSHDEDDEEEPAHGYEYRQGCNAGEVLRMHAIQQPGTNSGVSGVIRDTNTRSHVPSWAG